MPKLGHYLPFEQKIQKLNFLLKNLKINFLGSWGVENPKTTKNLPKLGHYLPFEQKIQK